MFANFKGAHSNIRNAAIEKKVFSSCPQLSCWSKQLYRKILMMMEVSDDCGGKEKA